MIPAGTLDDLNLVAVNRVQAMSQRAVNPLVDMVAQHYSEHPCLSHDAFLRMLDEAEAVMGRGERRLCGPCERGQTHLCDADEYLHCDNASEVTR